MKPNETGRFAYNYLIQRGLSPAAAAGIVGNLAIESGNFSPAVIAGEKRGDNGTAAYVQQLRGNRLSNFQSFVRDNKRSENDLRAQLDFILEEKDSKSPYADGIAAQNANATFSAADPADAALAFMNFYERPSKDPKINHQDKRMAYAKSLIGSEGGDYQEPPVPSYDPMAGAVYDQPVVPPQQTMSPYGNSDMSTGDALIRAAYLMRGETPPPMQASYAPPNEGGVSTPWGGSDTRSSGYAPSDIGSGPSDPLPIGSGAALSASGQNQFGLKPIADHVSLDGVSPDVLNAATLTANMLGRDIPVTSAYRSQAKQDRIRNGRNVPGVAKSSFHTKGTALDIPTAGMSHEEIAQLVDTLIANGFTGFGHYGEGKHIHADFRDSVPKSFNPDNGWGGWTSLPPYMMDVLRKRGYRRGLSASAITRGFNG
jgi:hypothetical protein